MATVVLVWIAVLLAGAIPVRAQAPVAEPQPPNALKKLSLDELLNVDIVSVSRRVEKLFEAPSAIQVITGEDIQRSGATSIPEALRLASNLQVVQVDARQWAITARGFTSTSANKLLVLIDGRTIYTPLYSGVFWDAQDVPLSEIDRIEVISGPGATLWGANAVNGVINITTKAASDSRGLLLSGGWGSALPGFGGARYGGSAGPNLHYRLYGKGFARDPSALPSGAKATDDWHLGQGGFRADWEASTVDHLTLQGDLYDGRVAQATGSDIAVGGGNVLGRFSRTVIGRSDVRVQLYFDRTHRNIPGSFTYDVNTFDLDFQHQAHAGTRHVLVWGVGYRFISDTVGNTAALAFLPASVTQGLLTAFAQDEITLVKDRLVLALGSKIEHNHYTGVELQPSGRLSWNANAENTVWGSMSRAVRTPSRIDRELFAPGSPPFTTIVGSPNFDSETLLAYELGYRTRPFTAVSFAVSTFYNVYDRVRSTERLNPPAPLPITLGNGQEGRSYGAELTADYQVTNGWRLRAGYTGLHTRIRPKPGSTDISMGASEAHDPNHQVQIRSFLDLPRGLGFDGGFRYVTRIANQNVPAYAELNARMSWRPDPRLQLAIVGQNLLHDHHAEFGAGMARREIRRSVLGSVTWQF